MGNVVQMCTGKSKAGQEDGGEAKEGTGAGALDKIKGKMKNVNINDIGFLANFLRQKVGGSSSVTHAAILNMADGSLTISVPDGFQLEKQSIDTILDAFRTTGTEESSQLSEHGLTIGESTYHPEGKGNGKMIVCTDEANNGCVLTSAAGRAFVLVYRQNREDATKMAAEIAGNTA